MHLSLIVGRMVGNSITIVGDTHLTDELTKRKTPPLEGVIKSFIIDPGFSVSFVGLVEVASESLRRFRYEWRTKASIDAVIQHFLAFHLQSDQRVEYILAFCKPTNKLIEIKRGTVSEVQAAWIGDAKAFEVFQNAFHRGLRPAQPASGYVYDTIATPDHPDTEHNLVERMKKALQVVIEDASVSSVAGFVVPVASFKDDLRYVEYLQSHVSKLNLSVIGNTAPLPLRGASKGDYTMCFFFAHNGCSCHPMVYFFQGEFGVLFTPDRCGVSRIYHHIQGKEAEIYRAFIYRSSSIKGFIEQVRTETGLTVNTQFADQHFLKVSTRGMFGKLRNKRSYKK
jgi:hypothetical protein